MAGERRTKAQKEKISLRRTQQTYSFTPTDVEGLSQRVVSTAGQEKSRSPLQRSINSLFAYDPALIYQDLRKTVVITILVFMVLIGIRSYFG